MRKEPKGKTNHIVIAGTIMGYFGFSINCPWWIVWPCAIFGGIAAAEAIADIKKKKEEVDDF